MKNSGMYSFAVNHVVFFVKISGIPMGERILYIFSPLVSISIIFTFLKSFFVFTFLPLLIPSAANQNILGAFILFYYALMFIVLTQSSLWEHRVVFL